LQIRWTSLALTTVLGAASVAAPVSAQSTAPTSAGSISGSIVQQDEAAATRADKELPNAPSVQLSLADEKLSRDPGSSFSRPGCCP